jgi:hypothetical protein
MYKRGHSRTYKYLILLILNTSQIIIKIVRKSLICKGKQRRGPCGSSAGSERGEAGGGDPEPLNPLEAAPENDTQAKTAGLITHPQLKYSAQINKPSVIVFQNFKF